MTPLVEAAIRSSVPLVVGLVCARCLSRRSAALRHAVLAISLAAAALVVPLSRVLPAWNLPESAVGSFPDASVQHTGRRAMSVAVETETAAALDPAAVLAAVWGAGFAASVAVLLVGYVRVLRIARTATPVGGGMWALTARAVSERLGIIRPVLLLQTQEPALLATCGLWRPRVLLPAGAPDWPADRLHAVLTHELAHVRRRDWAVQISAEALRAAYWFNPLLWLVCARLRRESELACDDAVLSAGVAADRYARHLIDLARLWRPAGPVRLLVTPMARPSTLERRIAAMLNPTLNRTLLSPRAGLAAALLLLAVTLPVAALRATQESPLPLTGVVYDPTGAVVPGVRLTLDDGRGSTWEAASAEAGQFEFPPVAPGRYGLRAVLTGFRALHLEFELRQARDWDRALTLQLGDLTERVHVSTRSTAGLAAPAGTAPQPVRVGGSIRAPRKIRHVNPVYPPAMAEAGREGVVTLEAIVARTGAVASLRVLGSQAHPDFARAAMDAVTQWRFAPTLLNGQPVDVKMTVTVAFSLTD